MSRMTERCICIKVSSQDPRNGKIKEINHVKAARTIEAINSKKETSNENAVKLTVKSNNDILNDYRYFLDKLFMFLSGVTCGIFIIFSIYLLASLGDLSLISLNSVEPSQILYLLSVLLGVISFEQLKYYRTIYNRAVELEKNNSAVLLKRRLRYIGIHFGVLVSIFVLQVICMRLASFISSGTYTLERLSSHENNLVYGFVAIEVFVTGLSVVSWVLSSFLQESSRRIYNSTQN